ncbi:hypothetical protein MGALJ_12590 [Mycobacterium gallinarum]|uniref:Sulfur globule protein n=1 Tax=Mycobacterium gallinarum TaxID=39689 RepID=A0A9W4B092_9MYCO|nr:MULTISPECIES: hypothetical protein [Mycobacterium]MDV3136315.1 hypothetical protein [Mycobacterium sp. 29Ha]BBY91590.1 hypothetical protein MGALJ_12590 [Mycobacterium gallinarum]
MRSVCKRMVAVVVAGAAALTIAAAPVAAAAPAPAVTIPAAYGHGGHGYGGHGYGPGFNEYRGPVFGYGHYRHWWPWRW